MKVLLVEDDRYMQELLAATLTSHRHTVDVANDGVLGLELASDWDYDLILLDVQLPKLDGLNVCRELRQKGCKTPILILTAKDSPEDIVKGLDAGADDYITKPTDPDQLMARMRAVMRRGANVVQSSLLRWGALCLNPTLVQVTYQQQNITLSSKEYKLLELFLRHPQRVFSRSAILDHLWLIDDLPTENAVTNLVKDLRRKLKAGGMQEDLIETLYGLGYRLKPEPQEPASAAPAFPGSDRPSSQATAAIARVVEQFGASLNQRMQLLVNANQQLQVGTLSPDQWQHTREEAHRLAGSLGTFGYSKGSDLARSIEHLFATNTQFDAAQSAQLSQLLTDLQQEIAQPPAALSLSEPSVAAGVPVLVIDSDGAIGRILQADAAVWGLQMETVPDWSTALHRLATTAPQAMVLVFNATDTVAQDLELLRQAKQQFPNIPVLILARQERLHDRVQMARLGGDRYLPQTAPVAQIFEALKQLFPRLPMAEARVMVVDDDPLLLQSLTALLQPWGLQVTCLDTPQQFWEVFAATQPDLLLLDLEMPTFNGIDLCRVVRQDARYGDLPILVITAHTEMGFIQQAFDAGADDLIRKPIVNPELVTRVLSRIERSRLRQKLDYLRQQQSADWQQQARMDGLTQIANRQAFDETLSREWRRHLSEQTPLSLILLDVDHFKLYNDRYGHVAGDVTLKQVASTLQRCVNPTQDLVARYGGEEFGIILPATPSEGAVHVARKIQQAIARLQIPHDQNPPHAFLSVSMGVTSSIPRADSALQYLIASADQALYASKERGRNTYCLYPL